MVDQLVMDLSCILDMDNNAKIDPINAMNISRRIDSLRNITMGIGGII